MLLSFSVIDFNLKIEEKNLLILYFFKKKIMFFQSLFGPKDHPIYLGAEYGLGKKIHLFHGLDLLTYIKYDFHGLGFKPIELVYILNHPTNFPHPNILDMEPNIHYLVLILWK